MTFPREINFDTFLLQLRAEHVMECHIARVTQVAPLVSAVIADRFDAALAEAKQLDNDLDENPNDKRFSEENTPFLGVPLSVKEAFSVTGNLVRIILNLNWPLVTHLQDNLSPGSSR